MTPHRGCFCGGAAGEATETGGDAPRGARGPSRRDLLRAAATVPPLAALARRAQAQPRPMPSAAGGPVAIDAGWVLAATADDRLELLRDRTVIVERGRIAEVRQGVPAGTVPRVDARALLLLPGFISGHTHACSGTPTRGLIEGGRSYARPLEHVEALDEADLDALTAVNVAELLRSGCTTHVEMSLSLRQAESYVRVADRWGVRGYPSAMVPGIRRLFPIWMRKDDRTLAESVPGTLDEIAAALRFGQRHQGRGDGRIRPQMGPHATDTHTPDTMQAVIAAARTLGNGLHLHLAQGARETETVTRQWGVSPVRWLERLGAYDMPVFGAHMAGVDWAADGPVLARHGVVFSHCPSAGGAGGDSMPYPEALGARVPVNIGIDTHSNDYVENLKLAVLYGQAREALLRGRSTVPLERPQIRDAVRGATLVPAIGLRRPDLGRIRPGACADLVAIDVSGLLSGAGALPPEPLNHLLYASGLSVRHVMTDGRWQVVDGHLAVDDEAAVLARGGAVARKIWAALETEGWFKVGA